MKPAVLFLTVLGCVAATPSGSYHTEYNYKTHSSAYKNNELQHQTDDQGYYRKDGDLEGRVRPRVDANSEHSEYVNPNLRNSEFNTGLIGGANGDMSSYGHMRADIGGSGNHDLSSEGLARVDRLTGSRGGAYSGYSSGSYGSNSYGSYGMSSNLRSLTSHLQQDLERDLQEAIQENRAYAQSTVGTQELERQLRQNLTDRLNNELVKTYGQQSIRGGLSYTISGGRLHSTANYDNQELQDLRSQIENSLLNQLRRTHQTSRYETHQSSHGNYDYSATTVRPVYYTHNPVPVFRPVTTIRPSYSDNYVRYTPISNPASLTTIASSVQNQLDTRLNELLEDAQRRYFSSSSSYSLTNADAVLENLKNELRNNITYMLNENVKMNFGQQIPRDGYMYSVGPNGQTSSQYNYAIHDLENLRSQIERNLIEKLNRDFERYRSRWYQQSSHSQSTHNSNQYGAYNTPRYETYSTPLFRPYDSEVEPISATPASSHITSLIGSGGTSSSNRHYEHMAGSRVSGYEIGGASGSSNVAQLQRQLQQDLSRQLQAAISRSQYGSYSSSGSYNPQSYQLSLQQLQNELNRNLTRQLQEYSASGSYSAYGNIDQAQLASLRNQLQTDLMRQLQQGLQQSHQASSSFSSSSSANYRSARGFDNYQAGQYRSGGGVFATEEDCVGDDPNAYNNQRMKRSYTPYRSQPIGLSNSGNYRNNGGYNPNYDYSSPHRTHYGGNQQIEQELGQQVDESDLTQQVEDVGFENLQQGPQQVDLGQQVDTSDLTQQVDSSSIGKLQQIFQGQEVDESDLTQQVEDANFGRLQLGSQSQHTQQVDDSDLTQQVEDSSFERLRVGSHNQLGQQVDNSENRQVENSNFGRLQLGSQSQQNQQVQQVDSSDLTQQVEDSNFGKLLLGSQSLQSQQQIDDSDLTQQVEDSNYGKLQLGSQIQPNNQAQQIDDSDLTQQVQDPNFERLQLGSQNQLMEQRQDDRDFDLTQQVQDSNFGKLQLGSHGQRRVDLGQQVDNTDVTQQVEEVQYGKLHLDSQGQSQVDDTDLTQQVQILQGKPQLGSHNQLQEPLGQEVDNSDLTQQAEDIHSGNTRLQPVQYNYYGVGRLHNQNQQQIQQSNLYIGGQRQKPEVGQHKDSPDLTQQLDSSFAGEIESESQQGFALQGQHQTSFGRQQFSESKPSYEINYLKKNFDEPQRQIVYKLENQLSKEVEDAVKNYYANSYSALHNYQYTYTNLLRELERNITKQLQAIGPNSGSTSYSYSYSFSGPQVDSLKKYLETDLKFQLQQKLSGSANFNQEQIDQEQSNINSNVQIQSNDFDSQRTSPSSNLELVQQQQNSFENTEQQQSGLGQEFSDVTHAVGSNNGRLQLGNQPIRHPPINNQDDLTQQIDTPFENPTLAGQQQIIQPTNQLQQIEEVSPQSTPTQFNPNQRGHYHYSGSYPSGTYQYSARFRNRKPTTDSNAFLNTEISQQQNLYPSQGVISQQSQFPTLNQVIQNQQHEADEVHSNKIEQQSTINDITQQGTEFTDGQHQENIELSSHGTAISQDVNQVGKQSLAVAEHDADMLIQALQNHVAQSTPRQEVTNRPLSYAQVLSQDSSGNSGTTQHQKSFQNFLNSQQVELAYQVENDLSKQLQDAISDNYYMISQSMTHTSNPQILFQVNYEQLLEDLRRNITIQCDQIFQGSGQSGYSSHSSYNKNSLTQEQREKLVKELQVELSKQLERNLQISYGIQQYNDGQSSRVTYSSSPRGASSPYGSAAIYTSYGSSLNDHGSQTNQLHYGQQEEIAGAETVSSLQPVEPQHPYSVIHNVEPQVPSNSNIGVKGSRRPTPVLTPVQETVHEPPVELVTPVQVNGAEEVADLNQENLPWWKRVGNKIKQGASNLKEKIIG